MLEMAMSFVAIADDGRTVPTTAVYYDFYANGYEYIFMMTALNDNAYDAVQKLLDSMMQTLPDIADKLSQIDVDALNDVMAKLPATMDAVAQLQQQLNSVASFLGNVGSIFG